MSFGLGELVGAVKEAGVEQQAANKVEEDDGDMDPPLVDLEHAAPMVIKVAAAVKVGGASNVLGAVLIH